MRVTQQIHLLRFYAYNIAIVFAGMTQVHFDHRFALTAILIHELRLQPAMLYQYKFLSYALLRKIFSQRWRNYHSYVTVQKAVRMMERCDSTQLTSIGRRISSLYSRTRPPECKTTDLIE